MNTKLNVLMGSLCLLTAGTSLAKPARYTCTSYCVVASEGAGGWKVSNLQTVRGKSNYSAEESWDAMITACLKKQSEAGVPGQAYLLSKLNNIGFSSSSQHAKSASQDVLFDAKIGFFKMKGHRSISAQKSEVSAASVHIQIPSADMNVDCKVNGDVPQAEISDEVASRFGG